jgi:alpha-L-arabinofuranosidase
VFIEDGKDILANESFTAYGWGDDDTTSTETVIKEIATMLSKYFNETFNQKVYEIANPVNPIEFNYEPELKQLHDPAAHMLNLDYVNIHHHQQPPVFRRK